MSAKLLKSLAAGNCTVRNVLSGECVVYWASEDGKPLHLIIRHNQEVNLLQHASVYALRRSNLRSLVNSGALIVV